MSVTARQPAARQAPPRPGVITAAALITCVSATGAAVFATVLAVLSLWLFDPVFDSFSRGDAPEVRSWVLGSTVAVVVLSVLADFLALRMVRRSSWARWALVALCFPTALLGIMGGYYIVPLAVTLAAVAVAVLLLLPTARDWFRCTPSRWP